MTITETGLEEMCRGLSFIEEEEVILEGEEESDEIMKE